MARLRSGLGSAVAGTAGGIGGLVLGFSALVTPLVIAGWVADAITSRWFLRALVFGIVWTMLMIFVVPLLTVFCRPPEPEQMARGASGLMNLPVWRRGWVARGLALIFLVYGAWTLPSAFDASVAEASLRMSDSSASLYGALTALEAFTAGTLLFATAFLLGSAFTKGAFREIVTLVFLAAWVVSILAGVATGKLWRPEWSLYRLVMNLAAIRSLWAIVLWGLAAWRLREVYKTRAAAAEQVIAA